LWDHIRIAQKTKMLTDEELFDSLTSAPATIWNLESKGILAEGKDADIVIAKQNPVQNSRDSFFQLNPSDILLVICRGEIVLFDEQTYAQLKQHISLNNFSKLYINDTSKYVKGDLKKLVTEIRKYTPGVKFPVEFDY
jgi:adenine deaminase